jgi:metal-sulfur cluster biosynthetic enzyme
MSRIHICRNSYSAHIKMLRTQAGCYHFKNLTFWNPNTLTKNRVDSSILVSVAASGQWQTENDKKEEEEEEDDANLKHNVNAFTCNICQILNIKTTNTPIVFLILIQVWTSAFSFLPAAAASVFHRFIRYTACGRCPSQNVKARAKDPGHDPWCSEKAAARCCWSISNAPNAWVY